MPHPEEEQATTRRLPRRVEHAAATHVGRRKNNEEALCVEPALGLYVVADGMGGSEGGELASALTVEAIAGFFRRDAEDPEVTWPHALDQRRSFALVTAPGPAPRGLSA